MLFGVYLEICNIFSNKELLGSANYITDLVSKLLFICKTGIVIFSSSEGTCAMGWEEGK